MEPERFVWRARRWGWDLFWVLMPFGIVLPLVSRRLAGKPHSPAVEAAFYGFAVVFSLLLLRAHLGPTQVLTVDDEGVRLDRPRALFGRHLWRLGWDEVARAVVVTGADARTLVFETAPLEAIWSEHGVVLTSEGSGIGARVEDEAGLLATLARRVPVVSPPPPFAVTGGREFAFRRMALFGPWLSALLSFASVLAVGLKIHEAWRKEGLDRLLAVLFAISIVVMALVFFRQVRGLRAAIVVGEEGIAYMRSAPGRIGRPVVRTFHWSVGWADLLRTEREGDRLVLKTPTIAQRILIGPAPEGGIEDAAGLIAALRERGVSVAE